MEHFEVQFSGLVGYQKIRESLAEFIKKSLPDNHFLMEVAVNEAINNAIKHGNANEEVSPITLKIRNINSKCIVRVMHAGKGFPGNEQLQKLRKSEENLFDEKLYDESGRGLLIMDAAADYMIFNRQGTEVMLVKEAS
ncbi:ATP-binding protein [Bacillus sp. FJAT-45350]|uniref:ATP-binding protein n=1 Tax=Bacillus sp. FJAT-45350 TaxID=2011014 RepID=UPI0015C80B79|nr:ATP-binding protein [Bacillus sp. FJAT-45350]